MGEHDLLEHLHVAGVAEQVRLTDGHAADEPQPQRALGPLVGEALDQGLRRVQAQYPEQGLELAHDERAKLRRQHVADSLGQ